MFCHSCGQAIEATWNFCGRCAADLRAAAPAAPAAVAVGAPAAENGSPAIAPAVERPDGRRGVRWALLANAPGRPGTVEELGVELDRTFWLIPAAGEQPVARWMCLIITALAPTEQGGSVVRQVFAGAGTMTLTTHRLVGTLIQGTCDAHQLDGNRGPTACFALDLRDLIEATLTMKKSAFGAAKESGLLLGHQDGSILGCDLDRAVDDRLRASRVSRSEAMGQIIASAIAARGATPADASWLADAAAGRWETDSDGDRTAWLVAPAERPAE